MKLITEIRVNPIGFATGKNPEKVSGKQKGNALPVFVIAGKFEQKPGRWLAKEIPLKPEANRGN